MFLKFPENLHIQRNCLYTALIRPQGTGSVASTGVNDGGCLPSTDSKHLQLALVNLKLPTKCHLGLKRIPLCPKYLHTYSSHSVARDGQFYSMAVGGGGCRPRISSTVPRISYLLLRCRFAFCVSSPVTHATVEVLLIPGFWFPTQQLTLRTETKRANRWTIPWPRYPNTKAAKKK